MKDDLGLDRADLDRWITGNYGEDQFKDDGVDPDDDEANAQPIPDNKRGGRHELWNPENQNEWHMHQCPVCSQTWACYEWDCPEPREAPCQEHEKPVATTTEEETRP